MALGWPYTLLTVCLREAVEVELCDCVAVSDPMSEDTYSILRQRAPANQRKESFRFLGPMLNETKTLLDNFYRPFNQRLAELLGDGTFLWQE